MRSAQFYAIAIFVTGFRHGQALSHVGGGAEVMGAADELARKAAPLHLCTIAPWGAKVCT